VVKLAESSPESLERVALALKSAVAIVRGICVGAAWEDEGAAIAEHDAAAHSPEQRAVLLPSMERAARAILLDLGVCLRVAAARTQGGAVAVAEAEYWRNRGIADSDDDEERLSAESGTGAAQFVTGGTGAVAEVGRYGDRAAALLRAARAAVSGPGGGTAAALADAPMASSDGKGVGTSAPSGYTAVRAETDDRAADAHSVIQHSESKSGLCAEALRLCLMDGRTTRALAASLDGKGVPVLAAICQSAAAAAIAVSASGAAEGDGDTALLLSAALISEARTAAVAAWEANRRHIWPSSGSLGDALSVAWSAAGRSISPDDDWRSRWSGGPATAEALEATAAAFRRQRGGTSVLLARAAGEAQ